ncbi:MAG: hypothetical protein JWO36_6884 [Myxococcales bacterium]|nr:hypothetical protein [Myxococcales bacterium]
MIDAAPQNCWPVETSTPKGSVDLGTGDTAFEAMPDQLALVYGEQGGFHIPARSRIHGLEPGDPVDIANPTNPRTRFIAYFENGDPNTNVKCGVRLGYGTVAGDYTIANRVMFDPVLGPGALFNKRFRVTLEVIDSTGGYAMDEKMITALPPIGWGDDGGIGIVGYAAAD